MRNNIILLFNAAVALIVIGAMLTLGRYNPHKINHLCKALKKADVFSLDKEGIASLEVSKDIFFPEKKKVEVKAVEQAKRAKKTDGPSIVYKGVMVWDGKKVGIFYDANRKKTLFLKEGEFIKDYKILDITAEEVVLSKKGGLSVVTLKIGGLGGL